MCVSVPVTLVRRRAQGKTRNDWHRSGRPAPESFTFAMYDTAHLAATGFRGGRRPPRISSRHIFSGSSRLSSSSRRVSPAETHCSLPIVSIPSYTYATLHSSGQTRGKCFFCVSKKRNRQKFIFCFSTPRQILGNVFGRVHGADRFNSRLWHWPKLKRFGSNFG
jgi:hypothetical protein